VDLQLMTRAIDLEDVSRIRYILAKHLEVPLAHVSLDAELCDLHVDLVVLARLAVAFEAEFELEIPDDDWLELTTVGELVACILDKRGAGENHERPLM
jgi:acyl carrier protein